MDNWSKNFYEKVKAMREQQKQYYATRSHTALNNSIKLEREVDAIITRAENILKQRQENKPEQQTLKL